MPNEGIPPITALNARVRSSPGHQCRRAPSCQHQSVAVDHPALRDETPTGPLLRDLLDSALFDDQRTVLARGAGQALRIAERVDGAVAPVEHRAPIALAASDLGEIRAAQELDRCAF